MKLALVSPLPPAPTGIAEFAARLARELARFVEVESFAAAAPDALARFDRRLYQIGNNRLHAGAYDAALTVPGIVELHDASLHHFLLGRLSREEYVEEIVLNEGEWARGAAEELWARRGQAESDEAYFRRPLLRRIVEAAESVVVHNPAAARRVRESSPKAPPVVEIPHYVEPPPAIGPEEIAAVRRSLGVPGDALLIGCFGYQRPPRRLRTVLRAAARLRAPWRLLVAGEFVSAAYETSLTDLLTSPDVIRRPFAPAVEFQRLAAAVDVCVNLRWPSVGETSGIAMKLMAAGKPVVVTDSEEWAATPEAAALRIDAGEGEEDQLVEVLELLAGEPEARRAAGEAAARHVGEVHAMERVARLYLRAQGYSQ